MDADSLRAFVAVVETGSLVAASRRLRMARATLRRRIDDLEARAGVPLLHRGAQGRTATEAGAVLAGRGRAILQETSVLLSRVREVGAEPAGVLRLDLSVGLPPQLLLPLVRRLRREHPRLSLRRRFADDPVARLLVAGRERRLPGPRGHAAQARRPRGARAPDLGRARDGRAALAAPARGRARRRAGRHERRHPPAAQLRGGGLGIAFLPDAQLDEARAAHERLVPVLEHLVGRERPLRLVVPSALQDIPRIRAVRDQLRSLVTARRRS